MMPLWSNTPTQKDERHLYPPIGGHKGIPIRHYLLGWDGDGLKYQPFALLKTGENYQGLIGLDITLFM
jgi:hypothetical protein